MAARGGADRIAAPDQLRTTAQESLVDELAYLYDYLNFAHPFREGNGRTQREFFAQLVAESDHGYLARNSVSATSRCRGSRFS